MSSSFVLVPGAGGDAHYWDLVAPILRDAGHRVVAPDLPAGDDDAHLADYADVIVAAARGCSDVVLVAQSMGGFSAPLAVERLDVERIVLVAPMIPAPGETPGEWWSATGQDVAAHDAPSDIRELFFHDVPGPVTEEVFARGAPEQSGTPFGDPWPLDAWPDLPTRVVAGRRDRLFPLGFMRELSQARLGVEPEVIDSGHLPAFSTPESLAERLRVQA